jgi:hypothetical protein
MAMVTHAADLLPSLQLCVLELGELGERKLRVKTESRPDIKSKQVVQVFGQESSPRLSCLIFEYLASHVHSQLECS